MKGINMKNLAQLPIRFLVMTYEWGYTSDHLWLWRRWSGVHGHRFCGYTNQTRQNIYGYANYGYDWPLP